MKIPKEDLFISVVGEPELRDHFFELDIKDNMEIPLFVLPEILDGPWQDYVRKIKGLLTTKGLRCGVHGPFHGLSYSCIDPLVREVAERRMRQGLQIASELDAEFIVFHSTYNQYIPDADYASKWPSNAKKGFQSVVDEGQKRKILMVLENVFDDRPEPTRDLLDLLQSDFLKVCIDVGHLNVFSKVPLREWFEVLSGDIRHFHLHNNFGTTDDHHALNNGNFDFEELFGLIDRYHVEAAYTIEVSKLKDVEPSLGYLREMGILESS